MAGKKVLVVDDSPTVRLQVSTVLKQAGFVVIEAFDGQDGLEKVLADPDIGAAILDVNMPRMNGLEMLEAVKAKGKTHVNVLMLTSEGQKDLLERAKKAGAKGWIVKPFKADLLVGAVKKLLAV